MSTTKSSSKPSGFLKTRSGTSFGTKPGLHEGAWLARRDASLGQSHEQLQESLRDMRVLDDVDAVEHTVGLVENDVTNLVFEEEFV